MNFKTLASLFAALFLLAACESTASGSGAATGGGSGSAGSGSGSSMIAEGSGDRVFFDTDRYELRPAARSTVENWAGWMRSNPSATVTIEGHADERGTREYNLALGDRRAVSARNYLVALGVDGSRIRIVSYGKERPSSTGHSEAAWQQNRRSVFISSN